MKCLQTLKYIVIHHSATGPITMERIREWHIAKGWSNIGYPYVVERDGTLRYGRPLFQRGAHCPPFNQHSIGICIVGDNRPGKYPWNTPQIETTRKLVQAIKLLNPNVELVGHKDVGSTKTLCPVYTKEALKALFI